MKKYIILPVFVCLPVACMGGIGTSGDSDEDLRVDETVDETAEDLAVDRPEADVPQDDVVEAPDYVTEDILPEIGCHEDRECLDDDPCNGQETCNVFAHECVEGVPMDDGFVCGVDPRRICLESACLASTCGDGFIDTGNGESCEPPGEGACGEDCRLQCESDEDCEDDGNDCNGQEYCDISAYRCDHIDPLPEGTECGELPRRLCIDGSCQESLCGDGYVDEENVPPEECDDGNSVEGDGCDNDCAYSCHGDIECDDGHDCTNDRCNIWSSHTCTSTASPATTLCRASMGDCDAAEYCNGVDADCPTDILHPSTRVCRPASGECDQAETCTGTSTACPADALSPAGTPCDDGDDCTDEDECDGSGFCSGVLMPGCCGPEMLAAGGYHTCVLLTLGGVRCWGDNREGQVGDGTNTNRLLAVDVTGLTSGVASVASGRWHSCAVLESGGIRCWGDNVYSQLGDGTTVDRSTPVGVLGLSSNAALVSAGGWHSCALLDTGGLQCWGENGYGQLGNGTTTRSAVAVDVTGLASGVAGLCLGGAHTCALVESGGVKCWGMNNYGAVGDGTLNPRYTPVDVTGLASGVAAVTCGRYHTCALLDTGGVQCWGGNDEGQLGNGLTTNSSVPVNVTGLSSGVTALSAGQFYHTCALLDSGGVMCWGDNVSGQLGDGTTTDRPTPVGVSGLTSGVTSVSSGGYHGCAALVSGNMTCWGLNSSGQLGDGTTGGSTLPVDIGSPCP